MCTNFQQSQTENDQNHQQKTKPKVGWGMGRGVNVDIHTHSTDWLLHLQGVEGLWITVQVKIRQQLKQTVHTSSHNHQYIFMPVLYAQHLTQLDGFKQHGGITPIEDTAVNLTASMFLSPSRPVSPAGVMEVGENLLFVLAASMWNE